MNTAANTLERDESVEHAHVAVEHKAQPFWNPYMAGIGLGLVLLAAFVIMGRGLGASGAFSSLVSVGMHSVAPDHTTANGFFAEYLGDGTRSPLKDWLVFEVIGVIVGGFVSGLLAHRIKGAVEKGPHIGTGKRLFYAFLGGGLMGFGAKLARGCTSGQALTGGAVLGVGSWAFMLAVFGGGYAVAYFFRRQWK
jgi:uncharacterized protein